jgi:5'-nucleotidase
MAAPLTILHFNDVYELESRPGASEPAGGAARFASLVNSLRDSAGTGPTLTLFSGDALHPSLLSTVTRGRHMVEVLNGIRVDVAVLGNHDLDSGVPSFVSIAQQQTFPWLLSNVLVRGSSSPEGGGVPLADAKSTHVIDIPGWGRVGFVGLWEHDCLATLATVDPELVVFEDPKECGRRLAAALKAGATPCDIVIALTHQRMPNDRALALAVDGIDLVLGGHDHDYASDLSLGPDHAPVVKSGSDFRTLSRLTVTRASSSSSPPPPPPLPPAALPAPPLPSSAPTWVPAPVLVGTAVTPGSRFSVRVERFDVHSSIPDDPVLAEAVRGYAGLLGKKLDAIVGLSRVPLDARFASVRTSETAVGNFVVDLMRQVTGADVAVLNSGTLRADTLMPPGPLRMRDLVALLPMQDSVVTVRMSGALLLRVLENSVSQYPKLEGRFAQVSGVRIVFDPEQPPGKRVVPGSVLVQKRGGEGDGSTAPVRPRSPRTPGADASSLPSSEDVGGALVKSIDDVATDSEDEGEAGGADDGVATLHFSGTARSPLGLHKVMTEPTVGSAADASSAAAPASHAGMKTALLRVASESEGFAEGGGPRPHSSPRHAAAAAAAAAVDPRRWAPLDPAALYTVSTKAYLLSGRDGYDAFLDPSVEVLVDSEGGPILPSIVRNHFRVLAGLSGITKAQKELPVSPGNAASTSAALPLSPGAGGGVVVGLSRRLLPRIHTVSKVPAAAAGAAPAADAPSSSSSSSSEADTPTECVPGDGRPAPLVRAASIADAFDAVAEGLAASATEEGHGEAEDDGALTMESPVPDKTGDGAGRIGGSPARPFAPRVGLSVLPLSPVQAATAGAGSASSSSSSFATPQHPNASSAASGAPAAFASPPGSLLPSSSSSSRVAWTEGKAKWRRHVAGRHGKALTGGEAGPSFALAIAPVVDGRITRKEGV